MSNDILKRTAESIGRSNAECAQDSIGSGYTAKEAYAAYLVNTVDTAREYDVRAEVAVQAFVSHWKLFTGKRKAR